MVGMEVCMVMTMPLIGCLHVRLTIHGSSIIAMMVTIVGIVGLIRLRWRSW